MRFFNTAGPIKTELHYNVDPLHRWDFEEVLLLMEQQKYFVLHAPRQTGKTSSLLALQKYLNNEDRYRCLYVNFEVGQAAREDVEACVSAICSNSIQRYEEVFNADLTDFSKDLLSKPANNQLFLMLSHLSALDSAKPLIVFIDEIDSLVGDSLISVLRQLRSGYDKRPQAFPQSIILCGVRDIKDYRIKTEGKDIITGGSAFNIKAESLSLGNFSETDIRLLYNVHTEETGQVFKDECFPLIMEYTFGQPWLVNALAYEVTFSVKENRDRSVTINPEMIAEAKERLILSRATHLDQLADKLDEERVRNVILPLILGDDMRAAKDDLQYCIDLGLVRKDHTGLIISNAIYREVIPRELTDYTQTNFLSTFTSEWIQQNGQINGLKLCQLFQQFWRENSEIWGSHIAGYQEAAPQLVFQAFLQRVANGTGQINREYALGRKRMDLMLKWKYPEGEQRIVIEIKTLGKKQSLETVKEQAIKQTAEYSKTCDGTESHLLIFDRAELTDWREKVYTEVVEYDGVSINIWGM